MRMRLLALLAVSFAVFAAGCGDSAGTTTTGAEPIVTTTAPAPTTAPPTTITPTTVPPATTTAPAPTTTPAAQPVDAATAAGVQDAVAAGSELTTGKIEGAFEIAGIEGAPAGTDVTFTFSGAFDSTIPAMSFVMNLGDLAAAAAAAGDEIPPGFEDLFTEMEIRQIGDTSYMRFPFFQEFLGVPTEWISLPAGTDDPTAGLVAGTPGNPAEMLAVFEDAGSEVLDAGPDPLRGFDTNRYVLVFAVDDLKATASPEDLEALEELGPLGVEEFVLDVWIDSAGLLHRFEMNFDGSELAGTPEEGAFERMTMRFDIVDHGVPVEIEAPPAEQVTDGEGLGFFG